MKKIGIVGGLGPESTVAYYQEIIRSFQSDGYSSNYPDIVLLSVNLYEFMHYMQHEQYEQATQFLLNQLMRLKQAGADFAAISANTPHLFFPALRDRSPLLLISIVEAACDRASELNLKRCGLFGTAFTMKSTFYQEVFAQRQIEIVVPDEGDQRFLQEKLFSEIELGIFKDETRQDLIRIIQKMIDQQHIDSLILGCTEFPLILTEPSYAGIPMLNTTSIHVQRIVAFCKAD
ncbi:MAG: aspartate/glutamate racemase family protein [Microbacter sp.]